MKSVVAFVTLTLLMAPLSRAQPPESARPGARVPEAPYQSVFKGYRAYEEPELASWPRINEDVAKAGGHIGIFRGAGQLPGKPAVAPDSPQSTPHPPAAQMQPPARGPDAGHESHR